MREIADGVFEVSMAYVPRSIAKPARLEFDTAVFGHGPAFRGRAVEKFRAYAG